MDEGDGDGVAGSLAASDGPLSGVDVERLLARSDDVTHAAPGVLRGLRADLTEVLIALSAAGEILSGDVAVLRRCLASSRRPLGAPSPGPPDIEDLPRVLAARPWGRGWSAPPGSPGAEEDPDLLTRSAPLWSAHEVMARLDLTSTAEVSAALEGLEQHLVTLSDWRAAAEARLSAVRSAIVREWSARVERSLDTPA